MNQTSILQQGLAEIFSVAPRFSRFTCAPAADPAAGMYWTSGDPVPKPATELAEALASTLRLQFRLGNRLRILTRIVPSPDSEGKYDALASVMYQDDGEMDSTSPTLLTAATARMAAAIVNRHAARGADVPLAMLEANETPWPLTNLMATPLASVLGKKIPIDIMLRVSGRAPLLFEGRFANVPPTPPSTSIIVVRGKLLGTKESGRSRTLGVEGACVSTHRLLKLVKVAFDQIHRTAVSAAVAEPWRRVELNITATQSSSGRAKPEMSYKLNSMRFV